MDLENARTALTADRDELLKALGSEQQAVGENAEAEGEVGDSADVAQPLDAETVENALADNLRERLARIDRALQRIDDGTYGRSIQSGDVIPDARLEADPAAELTVEEAAAQEQA